MAVESTRLDRRMFIRMLGGVACSPWLPCFGCNGTSAPLMPTSSCPPWLTPTAEHFQQFGARSYIDGWQMPVLDEAFTLRIGGLVRRELSVTLAELEASTEQVAVVKTMVCAFGLTSTALWTGVPLRVLLERAGVDQARVARVRFFGRDGFENNLPIAAIFDNRAPFEPLLAFRLYEARLPYEHGFPFRLLLADRYGYKNIKWLERIELTDRDEPTGQYQTRGYSDAGLIEPQVMTEGIRVTERLPVGPLTLCGFAVSGYAGIEAVELMIDEAPASAATLTSVHDLAQQVPELARTVQLQQAPSITNPDVPSLWSAWTATLELTPGEHRVRIRARDRSGREADATELRIIGLA